MQLNPGERSLLAYFTDKFHAKQALSALKQVGFSDIEINSLRSCSNKTVSNSNLSSLVYGNSGYDKSYGPLLAADPIVSGMSSRYESNPIHAYVLTMIIDNTNYQTAVNIIRQNGGTI